MTEIDLPFELSPFPRMPDINISIQGIEKLLKSRNHHKGSDLFPLPVSYVKSSLSKYVA